MKLTAKEDPVKRLIYLAFYLFAILLMPFVNPGLTYAAPFAYIPVTLENVVKAMDLADKVQRMMLRGLKPTVSGAFIPRSKNLGFSGSFDKYRLQGMNWGEQ